MNRTPKQMKNDPIWYVVGAGIILMWVARRIPEEYWELLPIDTSSIMTRLVVIGVGLLVIYAIWLEIRKIRKLSVKGLIKGIFNPIRFMYYRHRARKEVRYMEIYPCTDIQLEPGKVLRFVQDFANMQRVGREYWKKGKPYFRLHIAWPVDAEEKTGPIRMYLGYPQDRESGVKHTLKSVYPTARYRSISHDDFRKVIKQKGDGKGGYFVFTGGRRKGLPLKAFEKESHLGSILAAFRPGVHLDLIFSPADLDDLEDRNEEMIESLKEKKITELDPYEQHRKKSLTKNMTGTESVFRVTLTLWSSNGSFFHLQSIAKAIKSTCNYHGLLHFRKIRWWNPLRYLHPILTVNPIPWPLPGGRMVWTDRELAQLLHLPPGDDRIYQEPEEGDLRGILAHVKKTEKPVPKTELNTGVRFGTSIDPLTPERQLYLPHRIATQHAVAFAKTGFLKTSLLLTKAENLLEQWIHDDNAPGQMIIDPKGSGVDAFMTRIRYREKEIREAGKMDKIHYIDLASPDYAFGMNLLHRNPGEDDQTVADNVMIVLESVFEELRGANAYLNRFVRMAVETLLQDQSRHHTIFGVEQLLTNPDFREKVKIRDPELAQEWEINQEAIESKQKLDSMINRFSRLRKDKLARRLFGQPRMSLDLRKVMDEGHIVVVKAKDMTEFNIRLCLGHLVNQLYVTAKNYRKRPKRNFYVFLDEAPLAQFGVIPRILSVSRDQGLCLMLIAQYAKQFKPEILQAIKGNVNTVFVGRQDMDSAKICNDIAGGELDEKEVVQLPKLTGIVSTESSSGDRIQAVFRPDPPFLYHPSGRKAFFTSKTSGPEFRRMEKEEAEAIAWGRELGKELQRRDCKRAEAVDRWIRRYLGFKESKKPKRIKRRKQVAEKMKI